MTSRQADNPDGNVYTFIVDGKSYPEGRGYKVDDFEVRIALYQKHYFIFNIAPCSTMFVDNYTINITKTTQSTSYI